VNGLSGGRRAWRDLRGSRAGGGNNHFEQSKDCNGLKNRYAERRFGLNGDLVPQMAVRALRFIGGIGMVPVADDAGSKRQQRNQCQRNPEYADGPAHGDLLIGYKWGPGCAPRS
jgi:hypothetical protein